MNGRSGQCAVRTAFPTRLVLVAAVAAGAFYVLSSVALLVKLVLVSALLAYILDPLVVVLEARGLSRTASTSILFLLLTGFIVYFLALLAPVISGELSALKSLLAAGRANALIEDAQTAVNSVLGAVGAQGVDLVEMWHGFAAVRLSSMLGYVMNAVSLLSSILLVPFITFFLLSDGRRFKKDFVGAVPNRYFEFTLNLIFKVDNVLGGYLRGLFIESLIIGALATASLWVMHVKYFIVLGIVIGLTNIVPYFGPVLGAVPAVMVALIDTGDPSFALYVALALAVVQLIDNAALKPVLLARMTDMHPLAVLLVVLMGGKFFGVLGMLLSVPAAAALKVGITEATRNYRQYFRSQPPLPAPGEHVRQSPEAA